MAFFVLAGSAAAKPCWRNLIDDWYDGRIDKIYPAKCYQEALRNAPDDAIEYSDLPDDLTRALTAVIRSNPNGTGSSGRRVPAGGPGHTRAAPRPVERSAAPPPAATEGRDKPEGPIGRLLNFIGPNNADSIPLPLVFLAGLALLLMATGAAGMVTRRVQERRAATTRPDTRPEP